MHGAGGELEGTLQDLQFLAAAGMADGDVHQGILALVRSYLCLIKARQQVCNPGCSLFTLSQQSQEKFQLQRLRRYWLESPCDFSYNDQVGSEGPAAIQQAPQ